MNERIKGIKVVIGGDTQSLDKALKGANSQAASLQSELREVNRALKLDPTNTDLLRQKHDLLASSVTETKNKLQTLKQADAQCSEQFKKDHAEQYRALQREIVLTEGNLKKLESQAKNSNVAIAKIGGVADGISQSAGKVSSAMAPATLAIGGMGIVAFNAASDVAESQNKVEVAFGSSADGVEKFAETTLDTYGIAKGTALDMASLFGDMATSMKLPQGEAADMSTSLVGLAGDLASFKNVRIDTAQNALKGIFTGETESLKGMGIVMTQANLDTFAMANGFGKVTKDMTEAEKVQLRYAYVMDATKNAQGDFARTSDGAANSTRVMSESVKEAAAEFGQSLLPMLTPIIQQVTSMIKWFGGLDSSTKSLIITILLMIAAISPVAGIISAIAGAISFLCANPIVLLIAAIALLVGTVAFGGDQIQAVLQSVDAFMQNIFVTDWTNIFGPVLGGLLNTFFTMFKGIWDGVMLIFNGVIDFVRGVFTGDWERAWKGITEIFGGIFGSLDAIAKAPINGIIGLLNMAISAVNSLIRGFNSMGFTMPKWLGGGSWHPNLPSIPSIPFLAKGGTFSQGSAIVGEAGPELITLIGGAARVTPLTNSQKQIKAAGASFGDINVTVYGQNLGDPKATAKATADELQNEIQRREMVFA